MALKQTVSNGPLTMSTTWENSELPAETDDVLILHVCTLGSYEHLAYNSVTIEGPASCSLVCDGENSISSDTFVVGENGSITVNGSTAFTTQLRLRGTRSGAAVNIVGPTGVLTVNGDVVNTGLAVGSVGVVVEHSLVVEGLLRGACQGNTLVSVQGETQATLTIRGGIDALGTQAGTVVALSGAANVHLSGDAMLRGESVISGNGQIFLNGLTLSAPGDPPEWYPMASNVRRGIQYRDGHLIGSYLAAGYPQPSVVLSGIVYGEDNEFIGMRVDCPTDKALSTASYGVPASPMVGTVNLNLYVLKTAVVSENSVLRDVPRWTGGPVGTYWPVIFSQVQTGVAFGPNGILVGNLQSLDWSEAERRQIRQALGIAGDKTATAGGHLDAIRLKTDVLPAQPAAAGDPMTLTVGERAALADTLLTRDMAQVEAVAPEHSLCFVVLAMTESDTLTHPGRLTVFRTDGTTEFARKTVTTQTGADPITGVH